jgi:hypothetical protein
VTVLPSAEVTVSPRLGLHQRYAATAGQ